MDDQRDLSAVQLAQCTTPPTYELLGKTVQTLGYKVRPCQPP